MAAEVTGSRSQRRRKKRRDDTIQHDLKTLILKKVDTGDGNKRRRRILMADLSAGRD